MPYRVGAALNEENHEGMKRVGGRRRPATRLVRTLSIGCEASRQDRAASPAAAAHRRPAAMLRSARAPPRRVSADRAIDIEQHSTHQPGRAADTAAPWTSSDPCDTERRPFGSGTRGRPRPATDTTTLKSHESPSTGHCICATRCSCGPSKESILRSKSDSRCYGCNSSAGRRGRKQLEKKRNTGNAFPMVVAARRGLKRDQPARFRLPWHNPLLRKES